MVLPFALIVEKVRKYDKVCLGLLGKNFLSITCKRIAMWHKLTNNRWILFAAGLVLGLVLGVVFDPIRLNAQDPSNANPEVSWEAIPSEFTNLDVEYLSSPENWQETDALISALLAKKWGKAPIICEWEPVHSEGHTFWLYVAYQYVSEDPDDSFKMQGHGFFMLHHDRDQLDGYYFPVGEERATMVYPFGEQWRISSSDLASQLFQNLYKRIEDPQIEPLIAQSGKDLLRK